MMTRPCNLALPGITGGTGVNGTGCADIRDVPLTPPPSARDGWQSSEAKERSAPHNPNGSIMRKG